MAKYQFNKLVRDRIVDNQITSGAKPRYRLLSEEDHKTELVNKIIEEAQEITSASQNDVTNEIADVQQALDDLKEKYGLTDQDILAAQKKKNDKNGAFKKGIYVEFVEVDDSSEWAKYYQKNSDRYPRID